ncbi:DUF2789 family protein [Thalassotalea profundi]|uniref:DUF2789 domain-containing protein n=1 Tax=Thalassotalea profundi TaxID=2036687 RepID=A0ABQ3ID20_9GAMM|nr:DUF2789 family protein [Thalassotalea profundi]GHE79042.1 hypothetical protein GCM10011501_03710 [Thalassotalea profundi]
MDRSKHTMACLFAQLGISSQPEDIEKFVNLHRGIPSSTPLYKADIWNKSQANFLQEAITEDSDWSDVVDSLDIRLR